MKALERSERMKGKKLRGKRKRKEAAREEATGAGFEVDLADNRFAAVSRNSDSSGSSSTYY